MSEKYCIQLAYNWQFILVVVNCVQFIDMIRDFTDSARFETVNFSNKFYPNLLLSVDEVNVWSISPVTF